MNVYILKNENSSKFLPFMSEQRLEKINGIKAEKVRAEKICSYALLRYALFKEYGADESPLFNYGEREKPYLENYPEIFFNLSHADGWSACVVSDEEIGVDIQDVRPMRDNVVRKICTEQEFMLISDGSNSTSLETTCSLWCMKESYGKLTGKGFAEGFDKIETSELLRSGKLKIMTLQNGMFLSVCSYDTITGIEPVILTADDVYRVLSKLLKSN